MGYYYEHKAGGWLAVLPKEKDKFQGDPSYNKYLVEEIDKPIDVRMDAKDSVQAMVAGIYQEPTKPYGSVARYMPGGTNYSDIFNDKLEENWRLFFYPYLVRRYCNIKFNYGKQNADMPEMKYATLLFVAAYFLILSKYVIEKDFEYIRKNPKIMEPYFKDFETNSQLLEFTHEMIRSYVANVRQYMEEHKEITTLHNFFSNAAWNQSFQKSFNHHVVVNKENLKKITTDFKKL